MPVQVTRDLGLVTVIATVYIPTVSVDKIKSHHGEMYVFWMYRSGKNSELWLCQTA